MKLRVAAFALLASVSTSFAADLAARPFKKAYGPVSSGWSGLYIGGFGGYGFTDRALINADGFFGGVTVGYNSMIAPNWLIGIEGEYAPFSSVKSAAGLITTKIDSFGSVAGRLGYVMGPSMIYAKAGYGFAEASATGFGVTANAFGNGVTLGAGLEYMFVSQLSGKVEYLYSTYGGPDFHTFKIGLNYHLNWDGPTIRF